MFCAELGIKNIFEKLTKKLQKVFFQQYELIKDATMYHPCVVGLILTLLYTGGAALWPLKPHSSNRKVYFGPIFI